MGTGGAELPPKASQPFFESDMGVIKEEEPPVIDLTETFLLKLDGTKRESIKDVYLHSPMDDPKLKDQPEPDAIFEDDDDNIIAPHLCGLHPDGTSCHKDGMIDISGSHFVMMKICSIVLLHVSQKWVGREGGWHGHSLFCNLWVGGIRLWLRKFSSILSPVTVVISARVSTSYS